MWLCILVLPSTSLDLWKDSVYLSLGWKEDDNINVSKTHLLIPKVEARDDKMLPCTF